jgi:triphosphatase
MGAEPSDGFRRVLLSSETELKFAVERGRKPTVVEGMSEGTRQPSAYETIYFDTNDFDLRRHRVELCVRNRDGQVFQRIKTRQDNGNILGCQSHEIVLSDPEPNLGHARALLAPNLRDAISRSALKPRFRTRFSRISHQFANDSCITRASFDQGCIEATGRRAAASIPTRKNASPFLAEVPAALLVEEAARGYRLATGELPHAVGASRLAVLWDLPLPQAILRILRHGFQHFLDNYPAVTLAGEPEGIHQMRVAMRYPPFAFSARCFASKIPGDFSRLSRPSSLNWERCARLTCSSGRRFLRLPRQAEQQQAWLPLVRAVETPWPMAS